MEAVQTRDGKYSIEQSPYSLLICSNRRERERLKEEEGEEDVIETVFSLSLSHPQTLKSLR